MSYTCVVHASKHANPNDPIEIQCYLNHLNELHDDHSFEIFSGAFQLEQGVKVAINTLVYNHQISSLRAYNRLVIDEGKTVPNSFLWQDSVARYLITAHLIALIFGLIYAILLSSPSAPVVLATIGYQFSLCFALFGYFLTFVRTQFYINQPTDFTGKIEYKLFAISHYAQYIFVTSLVLLLMSFSVRFLTF